MVFYSDKSPKLYNQTEIITFSDILSKIFMEYFPSDSKQCFKLPKLAFSIPFAACILFGLFGNLLTIASVLFIKKLRKSCNLFIVSLALADFLLLTLHCYYIFYRETIRDDSGIVVIESYVFSGLYSFFAMNSVVHLVAISIDRYYVVIKPLQSRDKSRAYSFFKFVGVWLASNLLYLPYYFFIFGILVLGDVFYIIYVSVVYLFLPTIIMIFCYTRIMTRIRKRSRQFTNNDQASRLHLSQTKTIMRMSIVLVIFMLFCWSFFLIQNIYSFLKKGLKDFCWNQLINSMGFHIPHLNSCVNPLVYALMSKQFRDGYKSMFKKTVYSPVAAVRIVHRSAVILRDRVTERGQTNTQYNTAHCGSTTPQYHTANSRFLSRGQVNETNL